MLVPSGNLSDEVDEVRNIVVMPESFCSFPAKESMIFAVGNGIFKKVT